MVSGGFLKVFFGSWLFLMAYCGSRCSLVILGGILVVLIMVLGGYSGFLAFPGGSWLFLVGS